MYLLALPITVGTVLLSKRIIYVIYDVEYLHSARVLSILVWAELFIFVEVIMSYMLLSINKQKIILLNAVAGAILNVGLNFLLIPRMGGTGAALATVASDIYFFVSATYFLLKYGYKLNFARIIPIPLAASAIMVLFVFYFNHVSFLILIPLSILIYFVILFVTNYISNEDKTLLLQALRMKRGDVD
jgi:O-antigen/teichoic acid export membrane protein